MPIGNATIVIVGTIGQDPEIRTVGSAQVASFSVAQTPRSKQADGSWADGETTWFRCQAWRELGEHVAGSLHKGDRVLIQGTIGERKYADKDGNQKSSWEVDVEEIGPSLRFATAQVLRASGGGGRGGQRPPAGNGNMRPQQPAQQAGGYDDETPF